MGVPVAFYSWLPLLPHKGQIQTYPIQEHMEETIHQGSAAGLITTNAKDKAHIPWMWPETAHPKTCAQSWLNYSRSLVNFPSPNFFSSPLFSSQCSKNVMHETIILQNPGAGGKPQIQRKQNVNDAKRDQDPWIFIFRPLMMETRFEKDHRAPFPLNSSGEFTVGFSSFYLNTEREEGFLLPGTGGYTGIYVMKNSPTSIFKICVCPVCI